MDNEKLTTVGEIRRALLHYDDEDILFFGDGGRNTLTFFRIKNRGPVGERYLQFQFNEEFKVWSGEDD